MGRGPTETRGAVHIGVALSQSLGSRQAGGGFGDNVRRLVSRAMAGPGKGSVSASFAGDETEVTGSGVLSIDIPSGFYLFTGIVQVTYSETTTGGKVRAEVTCGGTVADATGSGDGGSGTVVSATAPGAKRLTSAGTVTLTPLLLATTGGAGTVVTTLRATRIASA